jgi:hypothetical protein
MHSSYAHQITQLRMKNQTRMVSAIAVMGFSLFVTAILPSLLIQYVYATQQLFEQPKLLTLLPTAMFVLGVGYFLITVVGNIMREKRAKYLEEKMLMELALGDDCCCGGNCGCGDDDLEAVMAVAEKAASKSTKTTTKKPAAKKKTAKKSTAKKTTKKSAKK